MGNRNKNRAPLADEREEDEELLTPDAQSPEEQLLAVLQELGQGEGGRVKIEKRRPDNRFEFVGRIDAAAFSLDSLQEEYGGGEYRVTVYNSKSQYQGTKTVLVANPLKPKTVSPAVSPELAGITKALQQQGDVLMTIVSKLMTGAQPQQDRGAWLDELLKMKQIFGNGGGGTDAASVLSILKTGMEIANGNKEGASETNWADVLNTAVEKAGPQLASALEALVSPGRPQPVTAPPAQPLPAGAAATALPRPAAPAQPTNAGGTSMLGDLKRWLPMLIQKAEKQADPELYADLIIDNISESQAPFVAAFLKGKTADDLAQLLAGFDARVQPHIDWFRALGQAVLEALADDGHGSPETLDGAGHGDDSGTS